MENKWSYVKVSLPISLPIDRLVAPYLRIGEERGYEQGRGETGKVISSPEIEVSPALKR